MLKGKSLIVSALSAVVIFYILLGSYLFKVDASQKKTYVALDTFQMVYKLALDKYVDPVNPNKLIRGALKGLLESVDGYSAYFKKDEYEFIQKRSNMKGDVGIVLSPHMGYYKIMAIVPNSPASRSGLLVGDTISEINGKGISEYDYLYVKALLKGKVGDSIKIGVQRGSDEDDLYETNIVREVVKEKIVSSNLIQDGMGYLKVYAILPGSGPVVKREIENLKNKGAKKLIIDLRMAYGNGYEDAVFISDLFLKKGTITILKSKDRVVKKYIASPDVLFSEKVVVLIDGTTWQAPEIVVSSLKENKRAKIVGFKTFGGAGIGKFIPMRDGDVLYLTHEVFCAPDGSPFISKKARTSGVRPDIKYPPEEFAMDLYSKYILGKGDVAVKYYKAYKKKVYEKQLQKAIELLKGKKSLKKAV